MTARDRVSFENSTETRQIILDNLEPVVRLNAPANNTLYPNTTVFFNFTAFEPNARNCTLYGNFTSVFMENISNTSIVSGANTILAMNASDGTYIWNVRCYDLLERDAFNSTNFTVRIDLLAPADFNLSMPANSTESSNQSPALNWTEAYDENFLNYTVLVDNSEDFSSADFAYMLAGSPANNSLNATDNLAVNREWFWKVIAYDMFNRSTDSDGYFKYVVDNSAPQVTPLNPANHSYENRSLVTFSFNVTDQFTVANCSLIINGSVNSVSGMITKNVSNSISTNLNNGDYDWRINCTDRAGNTNESVFYNITIDAPPLLPHSFVDTTDVDFGLGLLYRANVTGSGNPANVTLNYTTISTMETYKTYNLSGNFTSRVFDTGANNTALSYISWSSSLPNSSDVMGIAVDDADNLAAAFYRNGSFGVDSAQADLVSSVDFTGALNRYTLPAGWSYDDIACVAVDDDATNLVYLSLINGSFSSAASTFGADIAFLAGNGVNTIPANFNMSDVVGCSIDTGAGDSALFFRNRSMVSNTGDEVPPVAFGSVFAYTLPASLMPGDILGFAVDNTANDLAAFFINRSTAFNGGSAGFAADKAMTGGTADAAYNPAGEFYVNVTESTNITLQTRISNDTIAWTPWSSIYIDYDGSQSVEWNVGKYIQYKAVLTTRDKYITPYLENISINYSLDFVQPSVNSSINNTSPKIGEVINFTANISDNSELSFCQFIDNQTNGAKRFFNVSVSGQSDKCSQNFTIFLGKGNVINFSLIVNDSYNSKNQTDFVVTVINSPPVCSAGTLNNTAPFTNDVINQSGCSYSDADNDPQAHPSIYGSGTMQKLQEKHPEH